MTCGYNTRHLSNASNHVDISHASWSNSPSYSGSYTNAIARADPLTHNQLSWAPRHSYRRILQRVMSRLLQLALSALRPPSPRPLPCRRFLTSRDRKEGGG